MTFVAQQHPRTTPHRRRPGHNPLTAPLLVFVFVFVAVVVLASAYVAYVLWPRWPDAPVALDALDAPSLPIVIAGITFNIESAAIREPVQRRPGAQERVDLAYLWPSLSPPDPAIKIKAGVPVDPNERMFVTIQNGRDTMPAMERVQTIYPRYLVPAPTAGPAGLTYRGFRDDTPYKGEELAFDAQAPEHFLARCSRKGAVNSGNCLLERRIGNAEITVRFPRAWLSDWKSVADGIDRLLARLHPAS